MTRELDPNRANGGDGPRPITAAVVAAQCGGRVVGDGNVVISGIAPLDRASSHELSFFAHRRYAAWYAATRAGVVVVSPALADMPGTATTLIVVDKPIDAMVGILAHFHRTEVRASGVHPSAVVSPSAVIGAGVTIDALAVIGDHVTIGERSWIGAQAVVQAGTVIGADVRVHANATVYPFVEIGDRVIIHAGARIGREGFGFAPSATGVTRIPHIGRCVLGPDVEVGANSCIDRGSVDDTIVGAGTKIDNLVQVAHNVRIGKMCFLVSQTGVAGSTRIGDGVQLGGQVGVSGHLTIGDGATLAAQAGVFGDVPPGETWSGYPARPHKEQLRAQAALFKLVKIIRPLEKLISRGDAS